VEVPGSPGRAGVRVKGMRMVGAWETPLRSGGIGFSVSRPATRRFSSAFGESPVYKGSLRSYCFDSRFGDLIFYRHICYKASL